MNIEPAFNECDRRRPDEFREGTPIELNDGQSYHFAPLTENDKDLLTLLIVTRDRIQGLAYMWELAYRMLSQNYDISRQEMRALFPAHADDWTPLEDGGEGPSLALWIALTNHVEDGRTRIMQMMDDFRLHLAAGKLEGWANG